MSRIGSVGETVLRVWLVLFCGAAAANATPPLTYAQVWASAPPEPFASEGRRMLADGRALVVMVPRRQLEANIGRHLSSGGWERSAYARTDLTPCIIVIANDVPATAIPNLRDHEAAHCVQGHGGWGNDHEGALKPLHHLEACLATGLSLRDIEILCMLDTGAPLRGAEAAEWARMRTQLASR